MRTIPLVPADWQCHRTGDCCRSVDDVVMTNEEAREVLARRPDLGYRFTAVDERFLSLRAAPCPLLETAPDGLAACSIWDIRPVNCRRFSCYRPDPVVEPYEPEPHNPLQGQLGCANLSDRIRESRAIRRDYARRQHRAMRQWGYAHGWRDDVSRTAG